jgi:hypothetical protein
MEKVKLQPKELKIKPHYFGKIIKNLIALNLPISKEFKITIQY